MYTVVTAHIKDVPPKKRLRIVQEYPSCPRHIHGKWKLTKSGRAVGDIDVSKTLGVVVRLIGFQDLQYFFVRACHETGCFLLSSKKLEQKNIYWSSQWVNANELVWTIPKESGISGDVLKWIRI